MGQTEAAVISFVFSLIEEQHGPARTKRNITVDRAQLTSQVYVDSNRRLNFDYDLEGNDKQGSI